MDRKREKKSECGSMRKQGREGQEANERRLYSGKFSTCYSVEQISSHLNPMQKKRLLILPCAFAKFRATLSTKKDKIGEVISPLPIWKVKISNRSIEC
jgi:hypothetical protein